MRGVWIHSYWQLLGIAVGATAIVIAAAWRELKDLLDDIRASRARNKLHAVPSSKHR
jgi:hypothetical protein